MKNVLLFFFFLFGSIASFAQSNEQQIYYDAKAQLEDMLNGKGQPSYERAVFLVENAWYGNTVRQSDFDSAINFHLQNIRQLVEANYDETQIKQKPSLLISKEQLINQYKKALTNWAIYTYITSPTLFADSNIYLHKPYQYSYGDPMASNDWENSQVIHLNNTKQGNCFALASLFKILADRLQSNARLCVAPSHIYIVHEDEKGVKYNVELGSKYFPGAGMISAITYTTDKAIENGIAQRELSPKDEITLALVYLAKGYEHKFKTKSDDFILQCAETALQYDSKNLNAVLLKAEYLGTKLTAQHKSITELQSQQGFKNYQTLLAQLYTLGYREMPLEMKNTLLHFYNKEKATPSQPALSKDKNGELVKTASLSWGLFDERHTNKPTERYGNTLFDTKTKKIKGFATEQNLYDNYNFDPVVCALNIDPLAAKYPGLSPYSFAANNPIIFTDKSGAYVEGIDGKPVTYEMLKGKIVWSANASADVKRIGNAMVKTETGRNMFAKMQKTEYAIGVHLNNPKDGDFGKTKPPQGAFDKDGKFVVERADMYVNVNSMNMWKKSWDAETKGMKNVNNILREKIKTSLDGEDKQAYQDYLLMRTGKFEDVIGATGSHEAVHVTDPDNIQATAENERDKNKPGYIKQDVETVPNQVEQKELNERAK